MAIGLLLAIFPGLAIAKKLDKNGDWIRHLLFTPAFGLLVMLGISGACFVFGFDVRTITMFAVIANIIAIVSIRVSLCPQEQIIIVDRGSWFWIFTVIAVILAMQPLSYQRPMGVDWVGFSVLTGSISTDGFALNYPSVGEWIYPPAFPMLAAWLGGETYTAIFHLGTICFVSLILGIAAFGDKLGCSHWIIMSMMLAPALFAKNLDSGYPTVASQMGLVVVLAMFGDKIRWGFVGFTVVSVSLIHPTGLVYLVTLLIAHVIVDKGQKLNLNEKFPIAIVVLSLVFVLTSLAPTFSSKSVFSEYGWQGGSPMVVYSGLLLPLAIWAAWSLRTEKSVRILVAWFGLNWTLSLVSFLDGFSGFAIISMLSYALYSMSMHAFHIPLATILGLKLSRLDYGSNSTLGKAIMISALVVSGVAHSCLSELENHDELHVISNGDIALFNQINAMDFPDDALLYVENEHWGHFFYNLDSIGVTAVPSVGILKQDESIQNQATSAIVYDNISKLEKLGITHAIASPKGVMMQYIHKSTHWNRIMTTGGSSLYELQDDSEVSEFIPIRGDNMRIDPWSSLRDRDPFELGDEKLYITEGMFEIELNYSSAEKICVMTEFVGEVIVKVNEMERRHSGWHEFCLDPTEKTLQLEVLSNSENWINPLGASGRGDKLLDKTGVRLHWLEVRYRA